MTHGGGKNEVDAVKAVFFNNFIGAETKAFPVIVFVDCSLDGTSAIIEFNIALTPIVRVTSVRSFLDVIEI